MQLESSIRFSKPAINSDLSSQVEDGDVCIANISPAERRKRMRFGIVQFVITLSILAVLLAFGVDKTWRLLLVLPFTAAATGYFQARDKT